MSRSTHHRAPLLWLAVPAMVGLALAHAGLWLGNAHWLLGIAGGLLVVTALTLRRAVIWAPALSVAIVLVGFVYGQIRFAGVPERSELPPREARLEVKVVRVFSTDSPERSSGLGQVVGTDRHLAALRGQKIYWAMGAAPPTRNEVVEMLGVLAPLPKDPVPESFDAYLVNAGAHFVLRRAKRLGTTQVAPAYYRWCERMHARLGAVLSLGLEDRPELAGVLRAMTLGQKSALTQNQHKLFRESGTMHLFAISGLHIGVIAMVLEFLLLVTRMPGWLRFWIGTAALWLYVDITGAPPSAVRAFIMVVFVHAAWRWRVPGNALAALAAAALVVLVIAPEQLFSASFQLSYGIVASLLLLGLPLADGLKQKWALFSWLPPEGWTWRQNAADWLWRRVIDGLSLGVAASIVGILGGVAFFGVFTPGAFVANVVLVPMASAVLAAAVGAMLTGLVGATWLTVIFTHAAALLALIMEWLVTLAMRVPGMFFPAELRWPGLGPLLIAGAVTVLGIAYSRKWSPTGRGVWAPLIWVAAVLVIAVRLK